MNSTMYKAGKLLLIEKKHQQYNPPRNIPEEFKRLLLPHAEISFRQDNDCDMLTQIIDAGPFSLWMHDIFTREDIVLLPWTPKHILTINYMFEDSLRAESRQSDAFPLEEKECNCLNLHPGIHKVPMSGDKKILSVHINIMPASMPSLVQKYPILNVLNISSLSAISGPVNKDPHHINLFSDFLIQKLISCRYTGTRARYFIQRCCTDLLLNFAQQEADTDQPILFTNILHMDTFHQVFNYLVDNGGKTHSVSELAYMFYLSPDQLTHGFRQHFSIEVGELMYLLRMMTAYNMLHKKYLSLSDVAYTAGFSGVSEMVTHLERYYNCRMDEMRM